jgi:hypothetical protein
MNIKEYLKLANKKLTIEAYLSYERKRMSRNKYIKPDAWCNLMVNQNMCCYYCETPLTIIQSLIKNNKINLRKRGLFGYSGLHFELEHKDARKSNNNPENLAASCYYCNNDKSNTISSGVYKFYFSETRKNAYMRLCHDNSIDTNLEEYYHHLYRSKK